MVDPGPALTITPPASAARPAESASSLNVTRVDVAPSPSIPTSPALVAAPGGSTNSRPVTSSERLTSEISSPARRATELTGNSIARSPAVDWKRRQSSPALAMAASRRCSGPLPEAHAPNVSTGYQLGDVLAHMAPPNP